MTLSDRGREIHDQTCRAHRADIDLWTDGLTSLSAALERFSGRKMEYPAQERAMLAVSVLGHEPADPRLG
jgi:hypothetical protein